jgi:hypothetical protein
LQGRDLRTVLLAGAVAGALDITAAFAFWAIRSVSPFRVLRGIASGVLGPAAAKGGWPTAVLGLLLHFVIALGVAAVYWAASRWWPVLLRQPVLCGLLYGVIVYVVMNKVVVPLSRVTPRTPAWPMVATMIAIHMLFVGLPVALVVARRARTWRSSCSL